MKKYQQAKDIIHVLTHIYTDEIVGY